MRWLPWSLMALVLLGCDSSPPPPAADAKVGVVTIEFKLSGSVDQVVPDQVVSVPDVADGATLETVMRRIDEVAINLSGSGSSAFVDSIAGVSTDASQGWTFKVDGEFANQGIGQTVLHPPTTVVWTYGSFEM